MEFKALKHSERMELIEKFEKEYNIEVFNIDILWGYVFDELINNDDWETLDPIVDKYNEVYHDEEDTPLYDIYNIKEECSIYLLPSNMGLYNIDNKEVCIFYYHNNYYWVRHSVGQSYMLDYEYQSMIFHYMKEKGVL